MNPPARADAMISAATTSGRRGHLCESVRCPLHRGQVAIYSVRTDGTITQLLSVAHSFPYFATRILQLETDSRHTTATSLFDSSVRAAKLRPRPIVNRGEQRTAK
jgi:hypothetical protein